MEAPVWMEHLWVVYPGRRAYSLDEKVDVIPLPDLEGLPKAVKAS
jgi:hypothetical protein